MNRARHGTAAAVGKIAAAQTVKLAECIRHHIPQTPRREPREEPAELGFALTDQRPAPEGKDNDEGAQPDIFMKAVDDRRRIAGQRPLDELTANQLCEHSDQEQQVQHPCQVGWGPALGDGIRPTPRIGALAGKIGPRDSSSAGDRLHGVDLVVIDGMTGRTGGLDACGINLQSRREADVAKATAATDLVMPETPPLAISRNVTKEPYSDLTGSFCGVEGVRTL
jgi:hypothetical protein